jgi:hypothetical protein
MTVLYRWLNGKRYDADEPLPNWNEGRSDISTPMINSDGMFDPIRHPATGLYTDSKSTFRKMTRQSGCIEVGDQAPTTTMPKKRDERKEKSARVQALKDSMRKQGMDVL